MKIPFHLVMLPVLLAAAGCTSSKPEPKMKMGFGLPDGLVEYKKVDAADLHLDLLSKPVLHTGGSNELIFALRNAGFRRVNIPEWLRNEPENVKLLLQPYLPGMDAPDPEGWIEIVEPVKQPVIHLPLVLMPDNKVMISKKLDFVNKMRIAPGMERRFFLKAKINLKSLNTESEMIVLRILPGAIPKIKGEK